MDDDKKAARDLCQTKAININVTARGVKVK